MQITKPNEFELWDWKVCIAEHTPGTVNWLWNNHHKALSFEQFREEWLALPHDHPKRTRCVGAGRIRKQYAYLTRKFGFFTGKVQYAK